MYRELKEVDWYLLKNKANIENAFKKVKIQIKYKKKRKKLKQKSHKQRNESKSMYKS